MMTWLKVWPCDQRSSTSLDYAVRCFYEWKKIGGGERIDFWEQWKRKRERVKENHSLETWIEVFFLSFFLHNLKSLCSHLKPITRGGPSAKWRIYDARAAEQVSWLFMDEMMEETRSLMDVHQKILSTDHAERKRD